ncbi:MAG: transcriptional regulator, partial [Clostridia bacterium]|nr:transcriptional regulator [Clostridia bacterium]
AWINSSTSPQSILDRLQKDFRLGGHKAAGIAKVLLRANVVGVMDLEREKVEKLYMEYCAPENIQSMFDNLLKKYGDNASVLVIPQAGSILPKVKE